jgi:hypothetical protein
MQMPDVHSEFFWQARQLMAPWASLTQMGALDATLAQSAEYVGVAAGMQATHSPPFGVMSPLGRQRGVVGERAAQAASSVLPEH